MPTDRGTEWRWPKISRSLPRSSWKLADTAYRNTTEIVGTNPTPLFTKELLWCGGLICHYPYFVAFVDMGRRVVIYICAFMLPVLSLPDGNTVVVYFGRRVFFLANANSKNSFDYGDDIKLCGNS